MSTGFSLEPEAIPVRTSPNAAIPSGEPESTRLSPVWAATPQPVESSQMPAGAITNDNDFMVGAPK